MAIENIAIIDVISIDLSGNVVLTISDDLKWDDRHLLLLQNKINAYLHAIEDGEIFRVYPDALGRKFVINVVAKYIPDGNANIFLNQTKEVLNSSGYGFTFNVLD